ncbi:LVIVD repeat-containing protein [Chloroflexota bacterium]
MAENNGYIKNLELLAYHTLDEIPGFQMAMQKANDRYYLYITGRVVSGWHIMDVTEPASPRYVQFFEGPPDTRTIKMQVADGIMVSSMQSASFSGLSIASQAGSSLEDSVEGIYIFDVKEDPENPKFLSHWSTGEPTGMTHRFFYNGGRYIHLSSTCKGFAGMIYRIVDIIDPKNPVEVGRWWRQEQWLAGYTAAERETYLKSKVAHSVNVWAGHHGPPYVKGNLAYCSWGASGMQILDISDITLPQLVGQLNHNPPFAGVLCGAWCHTVVPLSQRPYAIMTSEGERFPLFTKEMMAKWPPQPMSLFGIVDVSDPTTPTLISTFPYPKVPEGFPYKNFNDCGIGAPGPLGPHNLHEPHDHPDLEDRNDRVYCCYFHAGLRIYDISDPFVPKEIAYYLPPNPKKWIHGEPSDPTEFDLHALPPGPMISTTEDIVVDNRGNIFMDTFQDGLYVLRCTV